MDAHTEKTGQQRYARHAGFWYIVAFVMAVFGNFFFRTEVMDSAIALNTAENTIANEGLFRLGLVIDLIGMAAIVPLACSLFIILRPVGRNASLIALMWWISEAVLLATTLTFSLLILLIVDEPDYLMVFEEEHSHAFIFFCRKDFTTSMI